jgi:hypothetical protein
MTIILCLDNKNGISFNNRRQSRDRILIKNIIKHDNLYIRECSKNLFSKYEVNVIDNIFELPADAVYFHEITNPEDIIDQFDTIVIYRWNRHYPSDIHFDFKMDLYKKIFEKDFTGSSHDKITKEIWRR